MRWWRRLTLRSRLIAIGTGGLAIGLAIGGLLIISVLHFVLIRSVDSSTRQTAQDVAVLVAENSLTDPIPSAGTALVQVLDASQDITAASVGADRRAPLLRPAELVRARHGGVVVISGGRVGIPGELRVVALRAAGEGDTRVIVVAAPTHAVEESTEAVRDVLLIAYPLLLAGLAVFAWRVVGWTLRPVEALRQGAERISTRGRTVGRLPVPDGDDEVHRLAVTLNDMLDRLDAARARQRAFVADAAHELRSPIASLRTQLEVADRLDEPPLAADLLADVVRLGRLTDDLLLLARADEGDPALRLVEAVDLAGLAVEVADAYANSRVPVRTETSGPVWTIGEPVALRRVVENLVANAVRHASAGVVVSVPAVDSLATPASSIASGTTSSGSKPADPMSSGSGSPASDGSTVDGLVRLTVRDDGPGIPPDDRERVFDRFTRLDNSRARDDGGAGLGLAIVRELLRLHDGSITLDDAGPGLAATVTLPAAER